MKKVLLSIAVVLITLTTGCNKDDYAPVDNGGEFGEPTLVDIMLVNQEVSKSLNGESVEGSTLENQIKMLEFYVYDNSGDYPDTEVGKPDADTDGTGYVKMEGDGLKLNQKLRVSAGANKKFLVVANGNVGPIQPEETFRQLQERIAKGSFESSTAGTNARQIPATGMEMSGDAEVTITADDVNNQVYITVRRLASKFETPTISATKLELKTEEQIKEIWGDSTEVTLNDVITFEYKGYALVNGSKQSTVSFTGNASGIYIDPVNRPWETWSEKARNTSTFNTDGFYTSNYSGQDKDGKWFLPAFEDNIVYVYENKPEKEVQAGITGYTPASVYAFIIEGVVSADGEEDETRYWRVDLTQDDVYHIMRNCVYSVDITKIVTPGYSTPKEAEERPIVPEPGQTAADFVIKVANWDINEYKSEM